MLLKKFPSENVYYILIREKIIIEKEKGKHTKKENYQTNLKESISLVTQGSLKKI